MHRETPLDFWLTIATVVSLFTPIWGILLAPSGLVSGPVYLTIVGGVAFLTVIITLVYARLKNRVLLNRFLIGYLGGLIGTAAIHVFMAIGIMIGYSPDLLYPLGNFALGNGFSIKPQTNVSYAAGFIYHYLLNGAAWGAAYSLLIGKGRWWYGVFYGLAVWAILTISPVFYALDFSVKTPWAGLLLLFTLLIAHLVYGGIIGYTVYRYVYPELGIEGSKAVRPAYR